MSLATSFGSVWTAAKSASKSAVAQQTRSQIIDFLKQFVLKAHLIQITSHRTYNVMIHRTPTARDLCSGKELEENKMKGKIT